MERTWSEGLEKRRVRKTDQQHYTVSLESLPLSRGSGTAHEGLPVISPKSGSGQGGSPTSQGGRSLAASVSEPSLSQRKKKTDRSSPQKRAAFLERQFEHRSVQARKDMAALHKQLIKDAKALDDVEFLGAKGIEGFRVFLEQKFGSLVAGWRALDREKHGRLSFYEFCNACRSMGYHGNLKQLWDKLDVNRTGCVSLMEIDAEVGHYIGSFKKACVEKWGDPLTAWRKGINVSGTGRVLEPELAQALSNLGLEDLNSRKLFRMLRSGRESTAVTLMDFDPDAWNQWITRDAKLHSDGGGDSDTAEEAQQSDSNSRSAEDRRLGIHTVDAFRAALVARCGSLLGAWREALDLDGNGRITFCEFCQAMQRLGFQAETLSLWQKLLADQRSEGKGVLFADLDPETDAALSELRQHCEEKHGNMLLAWLKEMDVKGTGIVNEHLFTSACERLGYSGNAKKLFRVMQPDLHRKFITLRDFDTKAFLALSRGDFRMLSEQPDEMRKTALQKTFMERQMGGWFFKIRKAWEVARREEFAKACKVNTEYDFIIDTPEQFDTLCIRRFGSVFGAWRQVIDWDGNGRITFNEFCNALRRLGYAGSFKALWKQVDKDKNGHISLKELDPETDTMISDLQNLLTERYGSIDAAWLVGFGKDPHDSCDLRELEEVCSDIGYPHDVTRLFNTLQLMPGRALITIWDLDPLCKRKRQRGDVRFISEPKTTWPGPDSRRLPSPVSPGEEQVLLPEESLHTTSVSSLRCEPELQALQHCLKTKYGSTVAAWRAALDPDLHGSVSFGRFMVVIDEFGFQGQGNVKCLWEELARGRPCITLTDLDADAYRRLERLRTALVDKHGCLTKGWEALDPEGTGMLNEEDFVARAGELGLSARQMKKAFQLLKSRHGQRSLVQKDLAPLLLDVPPAERAQIWSGEDQQADDTEQPQPQRPRTPSPHTPVAKATTLEELKRILTARNGSLFAAWRRCLDVDGNGVVTQQDLAAACRSLGVKNVQQLWSELDLDRDGHLSLKDVDPETAELFSEFEQCLVESWGATREGWKKTFLLSGSAWCEQETFVKQCGTLGFRGDAQRLFQLVRPETGRRHLFYEDLWPNLDPNFNRPAPKEPKDASKEPADLAGRAPT